MMMMIKKLDGSLELVFEREEKKCLGRLNLQKLVLIELSGYWFGEHRPPNFNAVFRP